MEEKLLQIKLKYINLRNLPFLLFFLYYVFLLYIYAGQQIFEGSGKIPIAVITILWIAVSVLPILENKKLKHLKIKSKKLFKILMLFLCPTISFVMSEIMVSNFNRKMFLKYGIYNVVWYYVIYLLIYVLIRNIRLTIKVGVLLIYLLCTLNYLIFIFRGNPILPSDLLVWKTGMSVASNYGLYISMDFMIASLLMLIIFAAAHCLKEPVVKYSLKNRLSVLGIYALFFLTVVVAFFHTDLIKKAVTRLDLYAPKYTYAAYGTAFGFVANVNAMIAQSPEGYSIQQVKETFCHMESEAMEESVTAENTKAGQVKPNIIAIMNEAYADLSMICDYRTNRDYLAYTRSLTENTIKGSLYVSVFGGSTCNTEYEFLTGNSMAVMPANSVPYQQFITEKTDSLATILKDQGYYNIAIHPYYKSGYKRDMVYPLLGFDTFLSKEDFKDPELIRTYISDRESYRKIIEEYEAKGDDNPLFIFNVTMQNHGGYTEEQLFGEEDTVRFANGQGGKITEQYLSLLKKSDEAFQMLIDYFHRQEEPTLILLFGDHQPTAFSEIHDALSRKGSAASHYSYLDKYKVPFLIWANYDIKEEDIDSMSANYLSSYLLKTAGLQGSPYQDYLLKLYETLPVVNGLFYMDRSGVKYSLQETSPYSNLLREYHYIGYNNALDKEERLDSLYSLDSPGNR